MRYYNPRKDFIFFGLMLQSSQKISSFFNSYAFFAFFSLFTFTCSVEDGYLYHFCSNSTNLAGNSAFIVNVDRFLSSLSTATVDPNYGFYNATVGKTPNIVYGNFLCRGDVSAEICHDCVTAAADDVAGRCRTGYEAVIWYEKCTIRYSNRSVLAVMAIEPKKTLRILQNVSEPDRLNGLVAAAVKEIAARAADAPIGDKKFATKEVKFNEFQKIYSLAQCTPDISGADCRRCLEFAIGDLPGCCSGKRGGLVFYPSCNLWYQLTPFYDENEASTPPPPVPPVYPPFLEESKSKWTQVVGISTAVLGIVLLSSFFFIIFRRKNSSEGKELQPPYFGRVKFRNDEYTNEEIQHENVEGSREFPSIQLDIINAATNHFCAENKLGQGGFGPVYKGILADGKEIAVKRLSRTSHQGLVELKNEVMLIAELQHKNLVRLLGCCLERDEKLLVYEFMPNRSLDVFLFDANLGVQLDWQRRFSIIKGIVRGILYLHEDSRLKIIHRDLKVSNILLDSRMDPKISDFGLARIFYGNLNEESTRKIVGTYGYMAPEYAMKGLFSIKSDVFSFGVLLLEIISGKKNNGLYFYQRCESLISYAWKLWSNGQGMELIDPVLVQTCEETEVIKCIHIGLLCVQKYPNDRPTMLNVTAMLGSETIVLPKPAEPAFFVGQLTRQEAIPTRDNIICSINELTLSDVKPR